LAPERLVHCLLLLAPASQHIYGDQNMAYIIKQLADCQGSNRCW
jgi:hypothetical protein